MILPRLLSFCTAAWNSARFPTVVIASALWCAGCSGNSPASPTAPATAAVCPNPPSGILTLGANEILRVSFTTPAAPTVDILLVGPMITESSGTLTFALSNGTTVLGRQSTFGIWKSTSSPNTNGTAVDFSAIRDGSINGRVEISVVNGTARFNLSTMFGELDRSLDALNFVTVSNLTPSLTLISTTCR